MGVEVDELEEDVGWSISCLKGVKDVEDGMLEEELIDKPGTTIGTKFSALHCIRILFFSEMWFLTVDPLEWVSVFIAKLSKRQYCWCILEDFHSQEYIQFFDVNCGLLMRLHFTIGCYNRRRTSRCRHSFQFSGIQIFFCWSCASTLWSPTTNSHSFGLRLDGAGRHQFSEGEKNAAFIIIL